MAKNMPSIEAHIGRRIGEVRSEASDISFGEIISLHSSAPRELVIQPDYQRLFRWSNDQRSRLIESILLELPIPQIFVIENDDGVLELIDGLQRISSVLHFVDHRLIEPAEVRKQVAPSPLMLSGCDLVPELNGLRYEDLPQKLKFGLKRSSVRMVTIKRSSASLLRYEMFKRLNTGGSDLAPQEIRNCTARMVGEAGITFYRFLKECASFKPFVKCIEPLPDPVRDQKGDEELVLRFFAAKNAVDEFRGSVRDWLDDYMDSVLTGKRKFAYQTEHRKFEELFGVLAQKLGEHAFVKYRNGRPVGSLAPAYFEAVSVGMLPLLDKLASAGHATLKPVLGRCVESQAFRKVTGPGANSKDKLRSRIALITKAFKAVK